ncbi:MAG: NUDIX domain-containing protein [Gordonia sp. (in: high G+C Gram-positive bacteria)]|uniref:NUDIX hydrolase n=1 Tax=Gordonia sp. (in: high G+C Gram-positive bacteria) TaxID=84139 RepID=UPI0039E35223
MPIPEFITALRSRVGTDLLWLTGVTAIVLHEVDGREHLLLGRRADTGEWAAVYGILEPGEQPAVAALREVVEETGVRARIVGLASVTSGRDVVVYPNGDRAQYLDLTFLCVPDLAADPDPVAAARVGDDESLAVGWFPLDALPSPLCTSTVERLGRALDFRADPGAGPYFVRP